MMDRRSFLKTVSAAAGGLAAFPPTAWAMPPVRKLQRIGVQLYTLPPLLDQDFEGTLATLAEIGYKELEFFGPYAFSPPVERAAWERGSAAHGAGSGYYGYAPAELRRLLDRLDLTAPSSHVSLMTLRTGLDHVLDAADAVGHRYVVCPFLPPNERTTIDGYRRLAEEFNQIGSACQKAGVRFGYHNHSFEFGVLEEQIPYDVLLENTDPDLVTMELDLFWITVSGFDPVDYFNAYPGRFELCHLKDIERVQVPENLLTTFEQPDELAPIMESMRPVGQGVIDFARILTHAERAGLKHYFVEHDYSAAATPIESVRASYAYLSGLEIPEKRA